MRGRRLTLEERTLWRSVARSVKPMRPDTFVDVEPVAPRETTTRPPAPVPTIPVAVRQAAAPVPASLGRRTKQRLARGRDAIDARLDLHGLTQAEAHDALAWFLQRAQNSGARFVIVVTGKGARGGESDRGVLRRQVPQWLRLPGFREFVVGFETAHPTDGGEGALYVQVRRGR
jgi:DNA-nicking Smr family endonuclease